MNELFLLIGHEFLVKFMKPYMKPVHIPVSVGSEIYLHVRLLEKIININNGNF